MIYRIGVMGSASGPIPKASFKKARILGQEIANHGCIFVNGATSGVPEEAAKGAKEMGGFALGISPAKNEHEHVHVYRKPIEPYDIIVYTGLGLAGRNHLNIFNSDALIFLTGGIGTFNEFSLAYDEQKVIGVLLKSGGFSDKVKTLVKSFIHKKHTTIIYDTDPKRLIEKVVRAIPKHLKTIKKYTIPD